MIRFLKEILKQKRKTLWEAISSDDVEALAFLLKNGQDPNEVDKYDQSPLFRVVYNRTPRQKELLWALIKSGAQVNFRKGDGATPLFYAKGDIAKLLLENGAEIKALSKEGSTAAHFTMDEETLKILLENGANICAENKSGDTPLHQYVYFGTELVQLALDNGANVNAKNNLGWTPLMCLARTEGATKEENIVIIRTAERLLKHGADILALDNNAMKASDHALDGDVQNYELAEYLNSYTK